MASRSAAEADTLAKGSQLRDAERVPLKFVVPFRHHGHSEELLPSTALDITAYGMLLTTAKILEVGTKLTLYLENLPGARKHQQVDALVRRTEIDERSGHYLIGVRFVEMDLEVREAINQALEKTDIMTMLRDAARREASDLHISADHPPLIRVNGNLRSLRKEPLAGLDVRDMVYTILDDQHRKVFDRDLELDFSIPVPPNLRFRVNVHSQRGNVEATFRQIEPVVRTIGELNLPKIVTDMAELREGLVLITGPTGSGKTTTAAAMIEHINSTRAAVVITMESPIEYVYAYNRSVIKQREIGLDTMSYANALRESMRQDPDVIFIGEVCDEETMKAALEAAQTGHLVIATFSAANAVQTIHRVYQFFDKIEQAEVRVQLANALQGIVSLRLLPRSDLPGVIPATEILSCTPAIANLIRTGSLQQIRSVIQTGSSFGMQSMDMALEKLVNSSIISRETAEEVRSST